MINLILCVYCCKLFLCFLFVFVFVVGNFCWVWGWCYWCELEFCGVWIWNLINLIYFVVWIVVNGLCLWFCDYLVLLLLFYFFVRMFCLLINNLSSLCILGLMMLFDWGLVYKIMFCCYVYWLLKYWCYCRYVDFGDVGCKVAFCWK